MVTPLSPDAFPTNHVSWPKGARIIRDVYPPIDLFEDIADPADWPLLISAMRKTDPRMVAGVGDLDQVPPARRVSGPGASLLMAPFTHTSTDRPSRFSDGSYGVLYVASDIDTALAETIHHHARFMASTSQPAGWTPHFRELQIRVAGDLLDIRHGAEPLHAADTYGPPQTFAVAARGAGAEGFLYNSVRGEGACCALFYPDLASNAKAGRILDYHWNGARVDYVREAGAGTVWAVQLTE